MLATKELAKLSAVIALVNRNFGQELTIGRITQDMVEDGKTYRLLSDGNTQNVFQISSPGITRFIQDVQPECIEDLIAINALYLSLIHISISARERNAATGRTGG